MQFTFTKLRFSLLIVAMILMGFVLFAVGRVTGDGSTAEASAGGSTGTSAPGGGAMSPAAIAARNKKIAQVTQVQGLLGLPQAPGQAQAMRAVTTSNSLAAMNTQNAAAGAPAGVAPGAPQQVAAPAPGVPVQQTAGGGAAAPAGIAAAAPNAPGAQAAGQAAPAAEVAPQIPVHVVAAASASDTAEQPFVLQLGAYRDQKGAKDLQASLQQKNVPTVIKNMVDNDQVWHLVRFGGYKDMDTASKAAAKFTAEQGILALVRRSDAF
jgi:DedD protein